MTPSANRLAALAVRVQACRDGDLWADATQAVIGDGPADARIALVGEQPGDEEDRAGEPFVDDPRRAGVLAG